MGSVGVPEMIVIFLVALVLFGPKKLPELGKTVGKALTEFRRASNDLKATFEREMHTLERETESLRDVANSTASEIYDHANKLLSDSESAEHTAGGELAAYQPSTVGASAVTGAESQAASHETAIPESPLASALEGTIPRVAPDAGSANTEAVQPESAVVHGSHSEETPQHS